MSSAHRFHENNAFDAYLRAAQVGRSLRCSVPLLVETSALEDGVRAAYSAAAARPQEAHGFPVGRSFALDVGYPEELLEFLPARAVDAFAGVSDVSMRAKLPRGATVLDLGCGAGLDALVAAQRVGGAGRVHAIDFSDEMLQRAREAAMEARLDNIAFHRAPGRALPLDDASIDVVMVNGIFNLNPDRDAIFEELARVMKPRGQVYASELVLVEPLEERDVCSLKEWFA